MCICCYLGAREQQVGVRKMIRHCSFILLLCFETVLKLDLRCVNNLFTLIKIIVLEVLVLISVVQ